MTACVWKVSLDSQGVPCALRFTKPPFLPEAGPALSGGHHFLAEGGLKGLRRRRGWENPLGDEAMSENSFARGLPNL